MKHFDSPFDNTAKRDKPIRITEIGQIPNSTDAIMRLGSSVVDLIPRSERKKYTYLRGASLGAVVYNLVTHQMLNTARDINRPRMHFADGPEAYTYANQVAESIAYGEGFTDIQFPVAMRREFERMNGHEIPSNTPGMIFALDKPYNEYLLDESSRGAREGVVWNGAVTLDMIDRRSREALENIVSNLT